MRTTQSERSYKHFIESLEDCIEKAYEGANNNKGEFQKIFLEHFYKYNAGLNVYIPKGQYSAVMNTARNNLIRKEFNGANHTELAMKYGVSLQWIYKIVKEKQPYELD